MFTAKIIYVNILIEKVGESVNELMNICSKCNTSFPLEENICPNCGSTEVIKIVRSNTLTEIYELKARKKRMIISLLICLAVFIALVFYTIVRISIESSA